MMDQFAIRCQLQFTLEHGDQDLTGGRFTAVAEGQEYFKKSLRQWLEEYYEDKYATYPNEGGHRYKFVEVKTNQGVLVDLKLRGAEVKLFQVLRENDTLLVTAKVLCTYPSPTKDPRPAPCGAGAPENDHLLHSQKHLL